MKTRDELLERADNLISMTTAETDIAVGSARALMAIACVMLAKERRESEEAPVVVTVPGTAVRPDIVATVAADVVRAIREAREEK